ncbi:hypothetical protein AB1Y20_007157 [Prymnesium parvum]|uniref:Plastid lipid-associated protein/fibrillin conserved domain-containing protein n=1 Tax=Prymnesium parvum TaxID=97485 RepID=A0AB34IWV8_PRYPA
MSAALLALLAGCSALPTPRQPPISRRTAVCAAAALPFARSSRASVEDSGRARLLAAIARGEGVEAAIDGIVALDPSNGRGATDAALAGRWRLLWSANAAAFSPLLQLPSAVRPQSYQLIGAAAERAGVGSGRIAQLLELPLGATVELSSAVLPSSPSVLEVFPPFRLQLLLGGRRFPLLEADSDADFRKANARSVEAQAAPRNQYEQQYLEVSGQPGDLRISRVTSGDPVIVGSVFVHQRV